MLFKSFKLSTFPSQNTMATMCPKWMFSFHILGRLSQIIYLYLSARVHKFRIVNISPLVWNLNKYNLPGIHIYLLEIRQSKVTMTVQQSLELLGVWGHMVCLF